MKKSLSLLLSLLMLISIITSVPLTASAASTSDLDIRLNSSGKSYFIYSCNKWSAKGELVIPSTYKNKPVTRIYYKAFENCTGLTSIEIPDSVKKISDYAFMGCKNLETIKLGKGVESIGRYVFYDCTSLKSINVDSENIVYTSVGGVLFNKDKTILIKYPIKKTNTTYIIPDNVTRICYSAFSYCKNLTSVTIGNSVTSIELATFRGCENLKSATIGNGVTSINYYAFSGCTSLKSIKIPDGVTRLDDEAFKNCTSLTSITLPDSVETIGYFAFYNTGYYNNIKNWDESALYIGNHLIRAKTSLKGDYTIKKGTKTIADKAFLNRENITSITISNSVTSIGNTAFRNCTSLETIKFGERVKSIGYSVFEDCIKLKEIYWNAKNARDFSAYSVFRDAGVSSSGIKLVFGDSVERIPANAFRSCKNITSITIPDTVKSIGYLAFYDTGYYNNRKNWDKSALYIGNHLIRGRHSLTGEYKVKDGTITIADMAFRDCDKLTSVKYPSSVKNVGKNIFYQCDKIK